MKDMPGALWASLIEQGVRVTSDRSAIAGAAFVCSFIPEPVSMACVQSLLENSKDLATNLPAVFEVSLVVDGAVDMMMRFPMCNSHVRA